eukprot:TRINITY_DN100_c0_g3_i1.p1 TRINITY_DN100_c0_g3~~TRINITY_DN100_c0_g3_i1.p1  ORF type:complete len:442 (+),score=109.02 TRINITY_DN100_c0_g3_i1:179-1504(+)
MVVLKVMWQDQIRRIGFEPETTGSFEMLKAKLSEMLGLQGKSFTVRCGDNMEQVSVTSDDVLNPLLAEAKKRNPPILRVVVEEGGQTVEPEKITLDLCPLPEPVVVSTQPEVHHDLAIRSCTACGLILGTTYYKCLNCMSTELCENCEESQKHDAEHLFVKLRVPVAELSLRQQMVFKDYIFDQKDRVAAREQKLKLREQLEKERNDKKAAQDKKRKLEKEQRELRLKQRADKKKAEEARKKKIEEARKKKVQAKKVAESKKAVAKEKIEVPVPAPLPVPVVEAKEDVEPAKPKKRATKQLVTKKPKPFIILTDDSQMASFHIIPSPAKDDQPALPSAEELQEPEQTREPVVEILTPQPSPVCEDVPSEPAASQTEEPTAEQPAAEEPQSTPNPFVQNLTRLAEMGFTDKDKNVQLLVKHVGDLDATVEELLRPAKSFWFF